MKYDVEKIANTIKFFIFNNVKYLDKTKLMKLFFFIDKEHLQMANNQADYIEFLKQESKDLESVLG